AHAYRGDAIGFARSGGYRLGELRRLLRGGLDLFDGRAGFGDGRGLRRGAGRLLSDRREYRFTCPWKALGATVDLRGHLAELNNHGRKGVGHVAELVLTVDADSLVKVARSQAACRFGHLPDGRGDRTSQQDREQPSDHDACDGGEDGGAQEVTRGRVE